MRRPLLGAGQAVVLVALVACNGTGSPSAADIPTATGTSSSAATSAPVVTPVPTPSAPVASDPGTSQTDTDWGRIWDALPAGFPTSTVSSLTPVEPEEPASGAFDASGSVQDVATAMQAILERGSYSTESMSGPFEDGSVVIESVGPDSTDCRVRTTIAPLGAVTRVTILYGAACPLP